MKATLDGASQRLEQYRKFHIASRALTMATIAKETATAAKKKKGTKAKAKGRK